jgi:type II secretory pathway pseudopilin PulG
MKKNKKNLKKNFGFTIIEMLVILGVLALLSGILIVYSRSGEMASNLIRQSAKMVADINRVKNLAITNTIFTDSFGEEKRTCGYGIYFDITNEPNQYIIFADTSFDCNTSLHQRSSDGSNDLDVITILPSFSLEIGNVQQIFFLPPDPEIFFTTLDGSSIREAEIEIKSNTGAVIGVEVNKTGQVSTF